MRTRGSFCSQIPSDSISTSYGGRHCVESAILIMPMCINTCFHLIFAKHTRLSVLINHYVLCRVIKVASAHMRGSVDSAYNVFDNVI
jgi:hypothetical protein